MLVRPIVHSPTRRQLSYTNGCISWVLVCALGDTPRPSGNSSRSRQMVDRRCKKIVYKYNYIYRMDLRCLPSISPVILGNFNITLVAMNSLTSFLVISSLVLQTVLGLPGPSKILKAREAELLKRSVDSFIATESPIALTDLLCNIGSTGACVPGASSGIVIASPDSTNPDCNDIPI